jgi:hypothetical protein
VTQIVEVQVFDLEFIASAQGCSMGAFGTFAYDGRVDNAGPLTEVRTQPIDVQFEVSVHKVHKDLTLRPNHPGVMKGNFRFRSRRSDDWTAL